jgi:medium-chain acyl-[acyl-carrier-protein] hydrolase
LFISGHRAPQLPDPNPPIHQLPDPAFVAELRRLSGTPETVLQDSELMEVFLPLLRADFAICETYKYSIEAPLDCPLSVFGGLRDDRVSRDELAAWRSQTSASFTLHMFPGNHFFLESERAIFLRTLAQHLQQHLRRID